MPYLTVVVKQSHINKGYNHIDDSSSCVIALACQSAMKNKEVRCFFDWLGLDEFGNTKLAALPQSAQRLQQRIFTGVDKKKLKPFSFRVRLAA